jgi:hypothetical protein
VPWVRCGWTPVPVNRPSWWVSHAAFPTLISAADNKFDLLVSSRDGLQKSSCAHLTLELQGSSLRVSHVTKEPLLEPGRPGCFDEAGVNVTHAQLSDGELTVWYHGWVLKRDGGWLNSIGCARGTLQHGLKRISSAPVFDRGPEDPTSLGYPFWFNLPIGRTLFYSSYETYGVPSLGQPYSYRVKAATGEELMRSVSLLPHTGILEAQSRPTVVYFGGRYRMFLSVKGTHYHIRGAESCDGTNWSWSSDEWSLHPSGNSGEILEVAYSFVFEHQGQLLMFYNGDSHGETGIGLALWQ